MSSHRLPGTETSGSQAEEHRSDEFTKAGWVHGVKLVFPAVVHVVTIQGGPRQADPLSSIIVG